MQHVVTASTAKALRQRRIFHFVLDLLSLTTVEPAGARAILLRWSGPTAEIANFKVSAVPSRDVVNVNASLDVLLLSDLTPFTKYNIILQGLDASDVPVGNPIHITSHETYPARTLK